MTVPYDMRCPIARTLEIVGERWTILILRDLVVDGPRKFSGFRALPRRHQPEHAVGPLKRLEEHGLVERRFYEQHPPRADYALTDKGQALRPVLKTLFEWGRNHTIPPAGQRTGQPAD